MTRFQHVAVVAAAVSLVLAIPGCGGGGGGGDSGPSQSPADENPEGLWIGSTNTNRTVGGVVLDDGTYWVIYSQEGNSNVIAGALQGRFSTNGNTVSSSNGRDFNFEGLGVNDFTSSGTVAEKQSLDGTVTYDGGLEVFVSAEYSSDYELAPSLATIAGSYSGSSVASGGVEFTTATISPGGGVSGSSASGCTFSGSVAPKSRGNVYDLSVTFNGGTCANGTATVTGVAFYDAANSQLISMALNSSRTNGFLAIGVKD